MNNSELSDLITKIDKYIVDPTKGLPEEVFLFATSITPMVNVDLLVRDEKGRVLLAWRDDEFDGAGWHVPGGIVRLKESLEDRIIKTSQCELGCIVDYNPVPLDIVPNMKLNEKYRSHFFSYIYDCRLPENINVVGEQKKRPGQVGYLKWFDAYPSNMVPVQIFYKKYFIQPSQQMSPNET